MLHVLDLCNIFVKSAYCNIGDSGAEFMGGLAWPNLQSLQLGASNLTQEGTK